jgi:hypothetical protein
MLLTNKLECLLLALLVCLVYVIQATGNKHFSLLLMLLTNKLECLIIACLVSLFYVRWATGISLVYFFFITDALDK